MRFAVLNSFFFGLVALDFLVFWEHPWFYILLFTLGVFYLCVFVYGVFTISSDFFTKTYCEGDSDKIYLSYDDGPDPIHTPVLLDILEKENIRATFFVIGKKAEKHPELLQSMREKGHLIANHTYSHPPMFQFYSKKKVAQELMKAQAIIQHENDQRRFFRPPIGIVNPEISKVCKQLGFKIIGWNLRSFDTRNKSIEQHWKRVKNRLDKGKTVILLHDNRGVSVELTQKIIAYGNEKGMVFERVDALVPK